MRSQHGTVVREQVELQGEFECTASLNRASNRPTPCEGGEWRRRRKHRQRDMQKGHHSPCAYRALQRRILRLLTVR